MNFAVCLQKRKVTTRIYTTVFLFEMLHTVYVGVVHRVSYCTVYPNNTSVFCYISRNRKSGGLECFAFLCSNKAKVSCV